MFLTKYEKPMGPHSADQISKRDLSAMRNITLSIGICVKTHAHALYRHSTTENRVTRMP
jgi:hypothetical protein